MDILFQMSLVFDDIGKNAYKLKLKMYALVQIILSRYF